MSDWLRQHLKSPVPGGRALPGEESKRFLTEGASALAVPLSSDQTVQLLTYFSELTRWNDQLSLTQLRQDREVVIQYFLESLSALKALGETPGSILDLGAGAGFPGLVMKIARPALKIALVEANGKRVSFLHQIIGLLKLSGIPVFRSPFEQLSGPAWDEKFDLVVTRSLPPELVLEKGRRFLRLGGKALFLQAGAKDREWKDRLQAYPGMEFEKIEPVKLSLNPDARAIIFVKQTVFPPKPPAPEPKPPEAAEQKSPEQPSAPASQPKQPVPAAEPET